MNDMFGVGYTFIFIYTNIYNSKYKKIIFNQKINLKLVYDSVRNELLY